MLLKLSRTVELCKDLKCRRLFPFYFFVIKIETFQIQTSLLTLLRSTYAINSRYIELLNEAISLQIFLTIDR